MEEKKRGLIGKVLKKSGENTFLVEIERKLFHSVYHKIVRKTKRYLVDDPNSIAKVGVTVEIVGTRPVSALKKWKIISIIS